MFTKIYPNVEFGENVVVEDFCIIGKPPKGFAEGELKTVIGSGSVIRSHSVIYAGNTVGENFSCGHHVMVRESNTIGCDVSIGTLTCIEHHILIEDGVRIHSQAFIPEFSVLRKGCWIGPKVALTNAKYPRSARVKERLEGPTIGAGAKIGANSTILPGVTIGDFSLIGSGSVVTKSIPGRKVAYGNPALVRKDMIELTEYDLKDS